MVVFFKSFREGIVISTNVFSSFLSIIKFLKDFIAQLEKEPIKLEFEYNGTLYKGEGVPISQTCTEDVCYEVDITLNDENLGIIRCAKSGWKMDRVEQGLVNAIGNEITLYFE